MKVLNPLKCQTTEQRPPTVASFRKQHGRLSKGLLLSLTMAAVCGLSLLSPGLLWAQSSTCVPGMVANGNNAPWSEECYLNNQCQEQGNPCQANDVRLLNVYLADSNGDPLPPCMIGDMESVQMWGTFNNNTNTGRFAIRTRTEVWINGAFAIELNACSFDFLAPQTTNAALLGVFNYICGDEIALLNTWVGWETSSSTCAVTDVCGEYAPSKCSKDLGFLQFLSANFTAQCSESTSTTTEVCFTDQTSGGTEPYTYNWDFGDGGTSTLANPCHVYNATTGTFTVTLEVTDAEDVVASVAFDINLDTLGCCTLDVLCPPMNGGVFECASLVPSPDNNLITVLDSCGDVSITNSQVATGTGCGSDTMRITRSYFITDGINNDTCVQIFRVIDNVPPSITCPAPVTVQCATLVPAPAPGSVMANDNCSAVAGPTITFVGDVTSNMTCANRLTITRTYRATDACGNSSTCNQIITVFDNMAPVITCPIDVTVQCASLIPPPAPGSVTVLDNCGGMASVSVAPDVTTNMTCANRFTITRVYTAMDLCGNTATCAQTIVVNDQMAPTLNCPQPVTVTCASLVPAPDPSSLSGTDNCGGTVDISFVSDVTLSQLCDNNFTIARTYQATDACGNSTACIQMISVIDNIAPSITCPGTATYSCADDVPPADPATVMTSDNCGGDVTVTFAPDIISNMTCANNFTITRIYTASDDCGNSATCAQVIVVADNIAPSITCPGPVTVPCANQVPPASPDAPVTSDNCGGDVTVSFLPDVTTNQTCDNRLTLTRTYIATDECGNTATCTQVITVFDDVPPMITCPGPITVPCAENVPAPAPTSVVATDNCGGVAMVVFVSDVTTSIECPDRFVITRTYQATDACGNTATCEQTINVFDDIPPTIVCPAPVNVQCASQVPAGSTTAVMVNDNCGGPVDVTIAPDVTTDVECDNRFTITRVYTATDVCGNSATCAHIITVFDDVAPTLVCPGPVNVECAADVPPANPDGISTASDNCGGEVTVTVLPDLTINQTCDNRFTLVRTYVATDDCGNSGTCTQLINVFDDTPPTLTCPQLISVQCASLVPPVDINSVTGESDNCSGIPTITHVGDITTNMTCANRFMLTRIYQATDDCGNSATCAQTIIVFDATAPTLTCPEPVTVECANLVPPVDVNSVTAESDNCGGLPAITHLSDATINMTCANRFDIVRTYQATDECGNSATCTQLISVFDDTPPMITCPGNTTVDCAFEVPPANPQGITTASDNCGGTVTVSVLPDVTTDMTCANRFTLTRTYIATDLCGNSTTCEQIITVFDDIPPTIMCPAPVTVQCANLVPPANPQGITTASDNCGGTVTVSVLPDVTTDMTCDNRFTLTRTYVATDDCGNSTTCNQIITVFDQMAPTIECPEDLTIECANLVPPADTAAIIATSDNCGGTVTVSVLPDVTSNMTCANRLVLSRTYLATDDCGNSTACVQTITVFDDTPPVLTCPQSITVQCAFEIPDPDINLVTGESDNCGGIPTITFEGDVTVGFICENRFTVVRTYQATDECGNTSMCSQTIVVFDNTAPTLTCPADVSVECASEVPAPDINGVTAESDNCEGTPTITHVSDVTVNMTCANRFNITRTYRATDECGNSATCTQTIFVFDDTPPVITCPGDLTFECASEVPPANPGGITSASDNCGGPVEVTVLPDITTNETCANRLTLTRVYVATDLCGNSATCAQTIFVFDDTPPTLTCPGIVTVQCASEVPPVDISSVTAESDNCGSIPEITHVDDVTTGQTCDNRFTITRTYRATDECGNSATCTQIILVFDSTPPTLTCPATVTVDCANEVPAPDVNEVTAESDNCGGIPTITHDGDVTINQTCENRFTITRTYRATDECGNSATCTQTIIVFDDTAPELTCPASVTVQCASDVPPVDITDVTDESDNCGGIPEITHVSDVTTDMTCDNRFTITRTYRATDECGNSTTCTQTIFVFDDTPPALSCPEPVTVTCAFEVPEVNVEDVIVEDDNCGAVPTVEHISDVTTNMTCDNRFEITRTYRATDECGNSATCTQTIIVFDDVPPSLVCPGTVTVECASQVPAVNIEDVVEESDNCEGTPTIAHISDVTTDMTCVNRFNITRTYIATDECGNSATCTQLIIVSDNTPPTLTCPAGTTVQCASQVPPVNINDVINEADNCNGIPVITHVSDVTTNMTCANRFDITRTYRATDECGNSATCTQFISVFDNTPPVITCPAGVTVQCANQVPAPNTTLVTASDNCGGTATITFVSDVTTNMTCVNRFTLTRTYRATDVCGNSATCTQTITVFDNTPPSITCPANITVQCANQVPAPSPASVITSDNCGGPAPTVTFVSDVTSNFICVNRFTLTRTYRATDACGNSATCTQTITVFDNTAPTIEFNDPLLEGVPNGGTIEVQCFGQDPTWDIPSFEAGDIIATDNCGGPPPIVTFSQDLVDEGDCAVDGYINRYRLRWTATDACGNSSSAQIFMNLVDTIPPVILGVPDDITVSCDEVPEAPILSAQDECLCACVVLMSEDGPDPGCQDGQVITRTWKATDDCGNMTIEVQTITLIDDEAPELTIVHPNLEGTPNGAILEYTCNEGGIPEFFDDLSAEDIFSPIVCGGAPLIEFDADEFTTRNCKYFGYIEQRIYQWVATDACGNQSTFTITVHLIDDEEPVILGVPEMTCLEDPALDEIEAVDNCETAFLTYWDIEIPNPCGSGNALRRTYEAYDLCGNYVRDTVILIVNDNVPPVIEFVNPVLAALEPGEKLVIECNKNGTQYTEFGVHDAVMTDDCEENLQMFFTERVILNGVCVDNRIALVILQWTAFDACGNSSQRIVTADVVDNTPPSLENFRSDVTIGCNDELPELIGRDNCTAVTVTSIDEIKEGDCPYEYDVTRNITVTDACGNVYNAIQNVHVGEDTGPEIQGVAEEICDDLSIPKVTAWDPCAGEFVEVTLTEEEINLPSCKDGTAIVRTWTAVDVCGNVSTATQTIILGDINPPTIHVPTWSVIRKFMDVPRQLIHTSAVGLINALDGLNESSITISDDCDQVIDPVFTVDISYADDCLADGYYERRTYTWRATDACGNEAVLTFTVDIHDDVAPEASGIPADTVIICSGLPLAGNIVVNDYSEPVTVVYSEQILPGEGPDEFIVVRTWTATDPCGNKTEAAQHILWIPNTNIDCSILLPELVECNSHGVVVGSDLGGGLGPFEYEWEVSGECFIQSGQGTPEIEIYVGFTQVDISLTVTDAFGCSSVCQATLDCFDPFTPFTINEVEKPAVQPGPVTPAISSNSGIEYLTDLNLWPNPANGTVNISFEATKTEVVSYSFTNFLGQVVLEESMDAKKGHNTNKIDVSNLPDGTYLIQVKTEKEMHVKTLVIIQND